MWVDGAARVACVTPVRRMQGRSVTTPDGLPHDVRQRWADALVATGGSQCGFCTPGILMRLAGLEARGPFPSASATASAGDAASAGATFSAGDAARARLSQALVAHLCRCTGWQTIEAAALAVFGCSGLSSEPAGRDLAAAAARARLEGGVDQRVGPAVALGHAGFADDTCPVGALVAVPTDDAGVGDGGDGDSSGEGYAVAHSLTEARALAGKVQGRSTSLPLVHPISGPEGPWAVRLATTWVEPAYLEPDASWCEPGGAPASPVGNGGAFGGKLRSPVPADARRLADHHGRPVRVVWSREDAVRRGPKRPPLSGGMAADGSGVLRVGIPIHGGSSAARSTEWRAEWDRVCTQVAAVAPGLSLEGVPLEGPPLSFDLRGAVWAEAAVLAACAPLADSAGAVDIPVAVTAPTGGWAEARVLPDGSLSVTVDAGRVLDEVVLRSYAIGATHQALGLVRSEGIAVDAEGVIRDLTIRSFGIVPARSMPAVHVTVRHDPGRPAVNGSDAVFAAVAAAVWLADGLPPRWPTARGAAAGSGTPPIG